MISVTSEHERLFCGAETRGVGVYLDTWAFLKLAKGPEHLRQDFVNSIRQGGTLLFSFTNALEIGDLSGSSSDVVQNLLNSIGRHWFPLEMNPWKVVEKENVGFGQSAPFADSFMKSFCDERLHDLSVNENKLLDLSEGFFRLSAVVNWLKDNKEKIKTYKIELDQELQNRIEKMGVEYHKDRDSFNRTYPEIPYNPHLPATFALNNLMRTLVRQAKGFCFKPGDGADFSHAVLAAAFGSIVTLDKQWKYRIEGLPTPNHLAKVFYERELIEFVDILKGFVNSRNTSNG